jgi:ubiquinone/menaquinone biosynthesis C-methylase UbiE
MKSTKIETVCPICHGELDDLGCTECKAEFAKPAGSGVRSLICREMYPSDEAYTSALKIIDFWGKGWEKRLQDDEHKPIFSSDLDALKRWIEGDIAFQKANDSLLGVDLPLDSLTGKSVLNIGAGAGTEALLLAHSGADCMAMDITSQAAAAAETLIRKIGGKGLGVQADARFIPLGDSTVDLVYSSGVLHHSPDLVRSIAEIRRVLKPGGKAYIMLYATWSIIFVQMRLMLSMGEKAWETENRKNPHTTTYTAGECRELFSAFEHVSVRKTGASLKQLKVVGRFMPTCFDRSLDPYLGPRLNIVARKPV